MKYRILLVVAVIALCSSFKSSAESSPHLMTVDGGFTFAKSYNLELGYLYKPSSYFGVGGAVGCWKTFSDFGDLLNDISTDDDYYYDDYYYNDGNILRPYIKASMTGFSPDLYKSENVNVNLALTVYVMANPTFTREIEYDRPDGRPELIEDFESRWYSWGGEFGVNFYDDGFGISAGYSISTLELKTKLDVNRRAITADRFIHGIFLKLYFGI